MTDFTNFGVTWLSVIKLDKATYHSWATRTVWVTVEDDYGCVHRVLKTCIVPVQVPVTRPVRVCR
jgi:hypothetical protein